MAIATQATASWFQATARERIAGLVDDGSFLEFLPPVDRIQSPHLSAFDLPAAFDDGVIVGAAKIDGKSVLLIAQEGQFMGGTFAEVSGAKMVGLLRGARDDRKSPRTILLLLDSGGVRLQEANAGELAVAEVMRAVLEARAAGISVIAVVGGRAGAFGGAGLTAATCSRIVISEQGRTGVSGPEVIETNKGVEEFDSRNKALVWSVDGGKNRMLIGGADVFASDTMRGFRKAILEAMASTSDFSLQRLQAEQERLEARLEKFGECNSADDMWKVLGTPDPKAIRDMGDEQFIQTAATFGEKSHDAR
jgi:malonate decarboxylase beta subunit